MNYILQIDTSSELGSIVISANGIIVNYIPIEYSKNQAAEINLKIDKCLSDTQISFNDIVAVAVIGGPGSYTGLRIGLATAKGICYAKNLPLILISKLYLLAYQNAHPNIIFGSILPARIGEYYWGIYDKNSTIIEPVHAHQQEIHDFINNQNTSFQFTGTLFPETSELILAKGGSIIVEKNINLSFWANECNKMYLTKSFADIAFSEPFYLKKPFTL